MSVYSNDLEEVSYSKKQTAVFQPPSLLQSTVRTPSGVVQYIINMFAIEQTALRPRRINKSTWSGARLYPLEAAMQPEESKHHTNSCSYMQQENKSKPAWKKGKLFYKNLEEYFSYSSLHGLRYIGDRNISLGERLFWFCSFICAICFATYFINSIYTKYNENPVIISLNPTPTALAALPFPAITICSMNQAKKTEAEMIIQSGTDVEKMLLDDYCNSHNGTFANISAADEEATRWENVQKFILREWYPNYKGSSGLPDKPTKVNPSCQEILKVCIWRQQDTLCEELFNNALTDDGLCCTFNALPRSFIFRNPRSMASLNLTYPPEVDDWNPEKGYSEHASTEAVPLRAPGAGTHLGLTVVLDAHIDSYYCSSVSSVGFKVLLHNPLETPKMADFALLTPPGHEARIVIVPKIFDATENLRNIHISKRKCFFTNERQLKFYRTYTELNCKLECQANYTLSECDCVPFYLPKNRYKKICSKKMEACVRESKETMEAPTGNHTSCNCLPACFELGYDATTTYGKLTNTFKIKEEIIKNESPEYFMTNMAVLHFYFVETQFTRNTKSVLYGFSEFLSNTGGLLGLFMGFSFLSAVEVAYYLSLRLLCKAIRSRPKKQVVAKKEQAKNYASVVYPFAR